jgi:hypothetical protein
MNADPPRSNPKSPITEPPSPAAIMGSCDYLAVPRGRTWKATEVLPRIKGTGREFVDSHLGLETLAVVREVCRGAGFGCHQRCRHHLLAA